MRGLYVLIPILLLLSACMPPLTADQARATAVVGGCWPYGYDQPVTPAPVEPVRAGTPTPSVQPTLIAYLACTPLPNTPTATIRPTRVPTPAPRPTPPPPAFEGGRQEIGQQPGHATNVALAIHNSGSAAVGWIQWGALPDEYVGDVWIRIQGESGRWGSSRTVNRLSVRKNYGGLGVTYSPNGVLHVVFGSGDSGGTIYHTFSDNNGDTWSIPIALPVSTAIDSTTENIYGGVVSLQADTNGGLHLLYLSGEQLKVAYAYLPTNTSVWQVSERFTNGRQVGGALALLPLPNGKLRRIVLAPDADSSHLAVVVSDDGQTWQTNTIETDQYFSGELIRSSTLWAGMRPVGQSTVVAAWGQYAKGGIFAAVSHDGGLSFGPEERIAQHTSDGVLDGSSGAPLGGFAPTIAYDAATDAVAVAWEEVRRATDSPRIERRVRLSVRYLRDEDNEWRYALTPEGAPDTPPQLTGWGQRGALWGSSDGRWQWMTIIDERNFQARLLVQPVSLSAVLVQGTP